MKGLAHGTPSIVLWIILSLTPGWAQQAIGPRMVIEEKHFVANPIKEGETIEHTFAVRNMGDRALEIKKVNPG